MTAIKLLLLPLTIAVALLGPRFELWYLDGYSSDTYEDAVSYSAIISIDASKAAPNDCIYLPCGVGAPWEDDDCDD
jgi:hypothetical protein